MNKLLSIVLLLIVVIMTVQAVVTVRPRVVHEEQVFFSDKDAVCKYVKVNMDQEDFTAIEIICGKYYIDGEVAWSVEIIK